MNDLQWYPGHMTKAMRRMKQALQKVDLAVEVLDARIPLASRNPDIDSLCGKKPRLLVLNKEDLADPAQTKAWLARFSEQGQYALSLNAKKTGGGEAVTGAMKRIMEERIEKDRARGVAPEIRAMICGIPNVGKSALINCLAKRALTKTENRPGVTRGEQWITLAGNVRLLDTPGVLWPKFEDREAAMRLALIGSLNDNNLDRQTLAYELVKLLEALYPGALGRQYGFTAGEANALAEEEGLPDTNAAVMAVIAKKRGCIARGGRPDYEKMAGILLSEFRNGKQGRFTLERHGAEL